MKRKTSWQKQNRRVTGRYGIPNQIVILSLTINLTKGSQDWSPWLRWRVLWCLWHIVIRRRWSISGVRSWYSGVCQPPLPKTISGQSESSFQIGSHSRSCPFIFVRGTPWNERDRINWKLNHSGDEYRPSASPDYRWDQFPVPHTLDRWHNHLLHCTLERMANATANIFYGWRDEFHQSLGAFNSLDSFAIRLLHLHG